MTDRLSQLLHDEASDVLPPTPDPARILAAGRRLRRRRRAATGLSATAAVALLAAAGTATLALVGDREPDSAGIPPDAVVYGWQSEVHVDDETWSVDGTVDRIDHTAVGLLVTTSSPDRLVLLRGDGSRVDLGEAPGDTGPVPATSPVGEVIVEAEVREEQVVAVVRALEDGETVEELSVDPPPGWTGDVPFLDLDGDTLYLDFRGKAGTVALDLRTGDLDEAAAELEYVNTVSGGRTIIGDRREFSVVDARTGEALLSVPTDGLVSSRLSPDGHWYAVVRPERAEETGELGGTVPHRMSFYDVATGAETSLERDIDPSAGAVWGWTLDGDVFWEEDSTLVRCDPATAACTRTPVEVPPWGGPAMAETW